MYPDQYSAESNKYNELEKLCSALYLKMYRVCYFPVVDFLKDNLFNKISLSLNPNIHTITLSVVGHHTSTTERRRGNHFLRRKDRAGFVGVWLLEGAQSPALERPGHGV